MTTYATDATVRHQVFLQRYAGGQSKKAIATLARLRRDLVARLAQEGETVKAARMIAIIEDVESLAVAAFGNIWQAINPELLKHARAEAGFSAGLYSKVASVDFVMPTDLALINAVEGTPMAAPPGAKSVKIADAFKDFGSKKTAQITQIIRDGVALGTPVSEISSSLSGVMNTLQRRQLDTLVRTSINHVSAAARMETLAANDDITDSYRWVATLDNSTTLVCAGRDGKVYKVGQGPMPPAHWGCRSTVVPVIKPEYSLNGGNLAGSRPAIGADGVERKSARTTYGGWLKTQPKEFVDEALGPERSELFRAGKIKIDGFTDPTGRVYTLEELGRMNGIATIE